MHTVVNVESLRRVYRSHRKEPGLSGSLKGLIKRQYLEVEALAGVSFSIQAGEFVGYLGPNGAGKTTTLKVLTGLLYPTSGTVEVLGFTPWRRHDEFRRQITFVMGQKEQLWWDLPATESFLLNKEIYRIPQESFDQQLAYLGELLAVKDLLDVPVRNLSLGERMKLELIGSLLHRPRILFLDEPTIGLDVMSQKNLRDFLRAYNQQEKATIIFTSHYLKDIEELCSRVILLDAGSLLFDGSLVELTRRYSPHKIMKLTFADGIPPGLEQYGKVVGREALSITLEVHEEEVAYCARTLFGNFSIADISIMDVPLEDTIRKLFLSKEEK
jgi:ABC-2 type transport system ATP-binding protein